MNKIPEPLEYPRYLATLHSYVQAFVGKDYSVVRDILADGKWPCRACSGSGLIYDPADPPCPIEGNKMRDHITCTRCGGSGLGDYTYWLNMWGYEKAEFAARRAAFNSVRAVIRRALSKLTAEEAAALGWEK